MAAWYSATYISYGRGLSAISYFRRISNLKCLSDWPLDKLLGGDVLSENALCGFTRR